MHVDSLTVCDNVTSTKVKTSTLAGDGGAIISQIRRIEKNTKVEIQCTHVNTKNLTDEMRNSCSVSLSLECDLKSKHTRRVCEKEDREECLPVKAHGSVHIENKRCEKAVAEIIKTKESEKHITAYLQHKHGEHWDLIDVDARNVFSYCNPSMLKCITGFNPHGKMIKKMNKYDATACCPLCGEEEDWEHIIKCPTIKRSVVREIR